MSLLSAFRRISDNLSVKYVTSSGARSDLTALTIAAFSSRWRKRQRFLRLFRNILRAATEPYIFSRQGKVLSVTPTLR